MDQILSCAEVPFCGLDRSVTEEATGSAPARRPRPDTTSRIAAVMRRDAGNTNSRRVLPQHLPDNLLAQALASHSVASIHGPENIAIRHARRRGPRVDRDLHPIRHRRGADAAVLAHEVDDAPTTVALLEMPESERRYLRSPEVRTRGEQPEWPDRAVP